MSAKTKWPWVSEIKKFVPQFLVLEVYWLSTVHWQKKKVKRQRINIINKNEASCTNKKIICFWMFLCTCIRIIYNIWWYASFMYINYGKHNQNLFFFKFSTLIIQTKPIRRLIFCIYHIYIFFLVYFYIPLLYAWKCVCHQWLGLTFDCLRSPFVGGVGLHTVALRFTSTIRRQQLSNRLPTIFTYKYKLLGTTRANYSTAATLFPANNTTTSYPNAITPQKLDKWRKDFYSEPKNILAQNVCSRVDPFDVCLSRKSLENTNHIFTYKVKQI